MHTIGKSDPRVELAMEYRPALVRGSALRLANVIAKHGYEIGTVKLVCAHPPYLNSLEYTGHDPQDLSLINDPQKFYRRIGFFARQVGRVLVPNGICALLIGDVRSKGSVVPLGFRTMERFLKNGFALDSVVLKTQHRDRSSEFYVANRKRGGLLLAHEYLFILSKASAAADS